MTSPETWAGRAAAASADLVARFDARLLRIPGTHLGRPRPGEPIPILRVFNYWWQAHYLDVLVDAGLRQLRDGDRPAAEATRRLAHRLLFSIRLRQGGTFRTKYYDDTTWLALAIRRLGGLDEVMGRAVPSRLDRWFAARITTGFAPSGGMYWTTARTFRNAPTSAPVAQLAAESGHPEIALPLLDWLDADLADPLTGLIRDGIRDETVGPVLESAIYTYNQGPILTALRLVGRHQRASELIAATTSHLTDDDLSLDCSGDGDGGLFTGILVRHLALAALDPELAGQARQLATRMVLGTAERVWAARGSDGLFRTAATGAIELSSQVQAVTIVEAAARLSALRPDSGGGA